MDIKPSRFTEAFGMTGNATNIAIAQIAIASWVLQLRELRRCERLPDVVMCFCRIGIANDNGEERCSQANSKEFLPCKLSSKSFGRRDYRRQLDTAGIHHKVEEAYQKSLLKCSRSCSEKSPGGEPKRLVPTLREASLVLNLVLS
jgi:hypothetical protein